MIQNMGWQMTEWQMKHNHFSIQSNLDKMTVMSLVMMTSKFTLPTTAIASRYSTRYSDFLRLLDSNSTRSQKPLLAGAWSGKRLGVLKVDCKIMGPKVRVQWGSGPESLRRMNHIPEKASQPDPYRAAPGWGTEGWRKQYLFPIAGVFEAFVFAQKVNACFAL